MALLSKGYALIRFAPRALFENGIQTKTCPHCAEKPVSTTRTFKISISGSSSVPVSAGFVEMSIGEDRPQIDWSLPVSLCEKCMKNERALNFVHRFGLGIGGILGIPLVGFGCVAYNFDVFHYAVGLSVPGLLLMVWAAIFYPRADRKALKLLLADSGLVVIRAPETWQRILEEDQPEVLG